MRCQGFHLRRGAGDYRFLSTLGFTDLVKP